MSVGTLQKSNSVTLTPRGSLLSGAEPFVCPPVIYVILSRTPLGIGKAIRMVTRRTYNHASIAFEAHPDWFYSYARRCYEIPMAGGFVAETPARFVRKGRQAQIKVFAVPLQEADRRRIESMLRPRLQNPEAYGYNLWQLFGGRELPGWDVCSSFVGKCLGLGPQTPGSLEDLLDRHLLYEGPIGDWCDLVEAREIAHQAGDPYFDHFKFRRRVSASFGHCRRLAGVMRQNPKPRRFRKRLPKDR